LIYFLSWCSMDLFSTEHIISMIQLLIGDELLITSSDLADLAEEVDASGCVITLSDLIEKIKMKEKEEE